jgi:uncharacterized membrane protein (DUF373 family)
VARPRVTAAVQAVEMEPTHGPELPPSEKLVTIVKHFERLIAVALVLLLMIVVALATVELGALLYRDLVVIRGTLLDVDQTFELFGAFLLVFVGLELLTSLKSFVRKGTVHVDVVLEVALVALAQKVILLNPTSSPLIQLGVAALVLALAGALRWVRDARHRRPPPTHTSGA